MAATLFTLLSDFAAGASSKLKLAGAGEPEDQLRAPLEKFFQTAGKMFGMTVLCEGEFHIRDIGRPDYAIYANGVLSGYIEIKKPGKGADPDRYRRHDKKQWESFRALPNILYTDGNEWALYQNGQRRGDIIRLYGDIVELGKKAVREGDAVALEPIVRDFLTWEPVVPRDARSLAKLLAPLCGLLRDEVAAFLKKEGSPFSLLYSEWKTTLFPGQSAQRFADAYAQTVTFSLLLANAEGGNVLDLRDAEKALAAGHALLAKALKIFTDNLHACELPVSLAILQRIVGAIPPSGVKATDKDPWLYFYEDFLAVYDPRLRKDSGSYYTPVEAVQAMTRLTAHILVERMEKPHGFAAPDVMTLDPAAGTGTFLLSIIAETLTPLAEKMGPGAAASYADTLAKHLYGFELQVGPYAVAQLRLTRALKEFGALLPADGPQVYLTDTLESPDSTPQFPSLLSRELSEQHKKALTVKKDTHILVCIGNPPYDRHEAAVGTNRKETGGWVRWGNEDVDGAFRAETALLESFAAPVRQAGHGTQLKNLYNQYVYFWRWALWKVFEQEKGSPGIVTFITASSFLEGPAFAGMRAAMRRLCHEVFIIDLGGEGRGSRKEENIFNIQTPVCITLAVRHGKKDESTAGVVHYTRIEGNRKKKLGELRNIQDISSLHWQKCPAGWEANFTLKMLGEYFSFPLLMDIFPWQQSGVQFKRTWPISPDVITLKERWNELLLTNNRRLAFKETRDRKIDSQYKKFLGIDDIPIGMLPKSQSNPNPIIRHYGYRSFDSQYCFCDNRLCDYLRDVLWATHSPKQIYFATLSTTKLSRGPALTLSANVPDLDYFRGSYGAKNILPLYRDVAGTEPNILPSLLDFLETVYKHPVTPGDLAAYVYAVLAHNAFTEKFHLELASREIRVPLTKDAELFLRAVELGRRLIWLHSYGERMARNGVKKGDIPVGSAKCLKAVSGAPEEYPETFSYNESARTLMVGTGEFAPVSPAVYHFEVSGLKVVQSWLNYRMKEKSGRKSSPLDDIRPLRWTAEYTEGLLRLLWVLEATLDTYPAQKALLDEILAGDMFTADELPPAPEASRKAPGIKKTVRVVQKSLLS
ncbi:MULTISPECIES: type ISP restriction/modification enzyme [unclassified Desulfovibrio]|uniref:type ISP restriction/modification enzyme n=1 Tax=unclassified Desulfovibrio TaxID=2593640 RepID=UPI0013EDBE8F|nr:MULTISPECIES: type ISP restriction/modification enzyme [unclassified Desulfovibrio]